MKNVDIITSAATTEILGDGERVSGLEYKDRESGELHKVELQGVFIQIGLVPNTEWLKDSGLELSKHGEIVTDARAATNLPGIFAAGDATDVPYKQIIIAMGQGANGGPVGVRLPDPYRTGGRRSRRPRRWRSPPDLHASASNKGALRVRGAPFATVVPRSVSAAA